jgi:gamma-glutamylcyclotransferase (GGCT)/AIG2-like uncharacterized protein YtfP
MDEHILYFAYGSNLAFERLRARVSSAVDHYLSRLPGHRLAFHKVSQRDGSAKCDVEYTGRVSDVVHGTLYWIHAKHLPVLDQLEGNGVGYERKPVEVLTEGGSPVMAQSYFATIIDKSLKPLDWYKEHVLRGAISRSLPADYIRMIESIPEIPDPDANRRAKELAVYK